MNIGTETQKMKDEISDIISSDKVEINAAFDKLEIQYLPYDGPLDLNAPSVTPEMLVNFANGDKTNKNIIERFYNRLFNKESS